MRHFPERAVFAAVIRLYSLSVRTACLVLPFFKSFSSRLALADRTRLVPAHRDFRGRTVVWIHAASLGESKVLVEFLRLLFARHPDHLYVVTATSAGGAQFLKQCNHEAICAAGFLPADSIPLMTETLLRFSIKRVWLIETEIWPSMIYSCMKFGIPVGIANARLEETAFLQYRRFGVIFRQMFSYLDPVLVQNEEYSRRFTEIGVDRSRIKIMGNIKSRVSVKRPSLEEWKRLRRHMSVSEDSVVVTAGCIHAGEAPVIREAIDFLASLKTDWKWIIVPRYIDDVPAIMGAIGADAVLAREPFIAKEWRTCVIGAYGVMQDLYRIADAAVVGGSFIDNGCHNVWEAAQFCIPVIWGAHYYEQRESCETLLGAGVGFTASNGTDLAEKLVRVLKTDAKSFIKSMQEFMARHASDTASIEQVIP